MSGEQPADGTGAATTKTAPLPRPPRTWRPMALWSAGILLALGLAWLIGAVVVPYLRVRVVVTSDEATLRQYLVWEKSQSYERRWLNSLGGPEKAADAIAVYVKFPDWIAPEKEVAIWLLGGCGRKAVPVLANLLRSDQPNYRKHAARALGRIGPLAEDMIPELERIYENKSEETDMRRAAARGLYGIGPGGRTILCRSLDSHDDLTRVLAALMVADMRNGGVNLALAPLVEALDHKDPEIRGLASDGLWKLGRAAEKAAAKLRQMSEEDPDESVRRRAHNALDEIEGNIIY